MGKKTKYLAGFNAHQNQSGIFLFHHDTNQVHQHLNTMSVFFPTILYLTGGFKIII